MTSYLDVPPAPNWAISSPSQPSGSPQGVTVNNPCGNVDQAFLADVNGDGSDDLIVVFGVDNMG